MIITCHTSNHRLALYCRVYPEDIKLRLGEFDTGNSYPQPYGIQDRFVEIVALHPEYDSFSFSHDLVMLKMTEPVVFQPHILPVCVPEDDQDYAGQTGVVTGWGRLEQGETNSKVKHLLIFNYPGGPFSSVMKEVDLPILNNTECEASYRRAGYWEHIPDIFICAGYQDGRKDTCEVWHLFAKLCHSQSSFKD